MQAEWKNLIDMNKCSHFIALISTLLEVGQLSYPMPLEQVVMHEMCIKHVLTVTTKISSQPFYL